MLLRLVIGGAVAAGAAFFTHPTASLPNGDGLQLDEMIGAGHFGEVWRGRREGQVVAIKMLKDNGAISGLNLRMEAEVMKGLRHANIVSFVGVHDFQGRPTIVTEYMNNESLDKYLSEGQGKHWDEWTLVSLIVQVARGMVYLESKGVVHRDLAARNVLVGQHGECRVSDFGMTSIVHDRYYFSSYGDDLPVRWTAPEALQTRKFTIKSDVWSFGMLCYEVVTKGGLPFPNERSNSSVREILHDAFYVLSTFHPRDCLPQRGECPDRLYAVMLRCWTVNKEDRPYISSLMDQIEHILLVLNKAPSPWQVC